MLTWLWRQDVVLLISRANHAKHEFEKKGFEKLDKFTLFTHFIVADILSKKNPYFGKHLFCKTKTDYAYKLRVQDFSTGKNFSFDQCSKQENFAFFPGKDIL